MKKVLALILALSLALFSVAAFATDSKTNEDIGTVVTAQTGCSFTIVEDTEDVAALKETFAAALQNGDILAAFPEEVKAELPEGINLINEFITVDVAGYTEDMGDVVATFAFETLYTAAQTVIGAVNVDGAWTLLEGKVAEDGAVGFIFPADLMAKINNGTFALAVISD